MKTIHSALRQPFALLSCLLLAAATTASAQEQTDSTTQLTYTIANGKATVTGGTVPNDGHLVIPGTLGGYPVTAIGGSAFAGTDRAPNTTILELKAPSVERVEESAFYNCFSLTAFSLPEATSIGKNAFHSCFRLTTISLPNTVPIGQAAFYNCTDVTTLSLPKATSIKQHTFYHCIALVNVSLPLVTSIGDEAFNGCFSLHNIYLGDAPTLGERVFDGVNFRGNIPNLHHHPEYTTHFSSNDWTAMNKNEVVRPFSEPVAISSGAASATLRIRHAAKTAGDDWTYTVEQSTDLAAWAEATPSASDSNTADSVVTKSRTVPASAPTAFYRVQAKPNFFGTD